MDIHVNVKKVRKDTSIAAALVVSLRTAVVVDDWKLDKYQTSNHDILDSFQLALCNYELPKNNPR